jgi:hypothetical protein
VASIVKRLGELAEEINAEHRAFVGTFRKTVEHGIRAGELLSAAKRQSPHGTWLPWLRENFEGSARTAQEYMRLYNHRNEVRAKARDTAYLTLGGALKEIAAPKNETPAPPKERYVSLEELERRAEAGLAKMRLAVFEMAEALTEIHHGRGWRHYDYADFVSYVRGAFADSWLSLIADDLVDERGEPHNVFKLAETIHSKMPDAMFDHLLAQLPEEARQRVLAEDGSSA